MGKRKHLGDGLLMATVHPPPPPPPPNLNGTEHEIEC